eukprot:m.755987 g.755987  ORF g.755987 m.755987 type:complete len:115 (+) comp23183_c0_seq41:1066-1410(+)
MVRWVQKVHQEESFNDTRTPRGKFVPHQFMASGPSFWEPPGPAQLRITARILSPTGFPSWYMHSCIRRRPDNVLSQLCPLLQSDIWGHNTSIIPAQNTEHPTMVSAWGTSSLCM